MCRWICAFLLAITLYAGADEPRYLYKVISLDEWNASQQSDLLVLSKDKNIILLSKVDQLEKTILRDFNTASEVIILEIDMDKLNGPVSTEKDDAGKAIAYHYLGSIPLSAISEPRIIRFH